MSHLKKKNKKWLFTNFFVDNNKFCTYFWRLIYIFIFSIRKTTFSLQHNDTFHALHDQQMSWTEDLVVSNWRFGYLVVYLFTYLEKRCENWIWNLEDTSFITYLCILVVSYQNTKKSVVNFVYFFPVLTEKMFVDWPISKK